MAAAAFDDAFVNATVATRCVQARRCKWRRAKRRRRRRRAVDVHVFTVCERRVSSETVGRPIACLRFNLKPPPSMISCIRAYFFVFVLALTSRMPPNDKPNCRRHFDGSSVELFTKKIYMFFCVRSSSSTLGSPFAYILFFFILNNYNHNLASFFLLLRVQIVAFFLFSFSSAAVSALACLVKMRIFTLTLIKLSLLTRKNGKATK